jgi:hypothetical protein
VPESVRFAAEFVPWPPANPLDFTRRGDFRRVNDLAHLASLLLFGDPESRRQAARALLVPEHAGTLVILATTARNDSSWQLRVRALETLTQAAECAGAAGAVQILDMLFCD